MQHGEREHELQIALATALRERDEARAHSQERANGIDMLKTKLSIAESALAAARRECEGLERLRARLDDDRSIGKALRVLAQILDGEPTGPGDKRLAAEALSTHADLIALGAPGDGEEGTHGT